MTEQRQSASEREVISGAQSLRDPMFDIDEVTGLPVAESVSDDVSQNTSWTDRIVDRATNTAMDRLAPSLQSFTSAMEENVAPAFNAVHEAAHSAVDATQALIRVLEQVKSVVQTVPALSEYTKLIMDVLAFAYEAIIAFVQKMYVSIPVLLYRLFSLFKLPEKLVAKIVSQVTCMFVPHESNQEPMLQVAQGDNNLFTQLSSIVGMVFLAREPTKQELSSVNDKLRFSGLLRSESKAISEGIVYFLQSLPDVCKIWAERLLPHRWWLALFAPGSRYYEWMSAVESLHTLDTRDRASYDIDLQVRIQTLYSEGQDLVKECANAPGLTKVFSLINTKLKAIEELYDIVDASGRGRASRIVPFCLYLSGQPGRGKTFLTSVLPAVLANAPADTPNLLYTRNTGMKFWDNYTGQFCTLYDDFNAIASSAPPSEFEEMLAVVSNAPLVLNMADLSEKGKYFSSRVVLMTSNIPFPVGNEVRTRDAIWRRRHAMYKIDIDPRFAKPSGEVDPALVPRDNSHYIIRRHNNPTDGNDNNWSRPMSYPEFIQDVRARYRIHVEQQDVAMRKLREMVNEAAQVAQGKLSDELDKTEQRILRAQDRYTVIMAALVGTRVPKWYNDLRAMCEEEDFTATQKWVTAALVTTGLVGSFAAVIFLGNKLIRWMGTPAKTQQMEKDIERFMVAQGSETITREMKEAIWEIMRSSYAEHVEESVLRQEFEKVMRKYQVAEGAYSGPHTRKLMRVPVVRSTAQVQRAQIHENDENGTAVAEKVLQSLVTVRNYRGDMKAIFIVGRVMVVPCHFFCDDEGELMPSGGEITINAQGTIFREAFDRKKLVKVGDDLAFYQCGVNVRSFKDVRKNFITDRDLNNKDTINAWFFTLRKEIPTILTTRVKRLDFPITVFRNASTPRSWKTVEDEPGKVYTVSEANGWRYELPTVPGDCGGFLVANEKTYARKILGIHISGTPGKLAGTGHIVTQEMIQAGLEGFQDIIVGADPRGDALLQETSLMQVAEGNFSHYGKMLKRIHISTKTKIQKSLIHGMVFAPTTGPSVLSPTDPRLTVKVSPLHQGIAKYGQVAPLLDCKIVERVSQHISAIFDGWTLTMPKGVVSLDVAINGHPHYSFAEGIPMDTSAGYPWNQEKKVEGGKADLFGGEPGEKFIRDNSLKIAVEHRWEESLEGRRVPSLWIDCLKDERRSLEKIALGKTRVFTIPPVDFTINFRRLTFAFCVNFYNNNLRFFSAVGMNPESGDWTTLFAALREKGEKGFDGDYSNWDGSLAPQLIMEVAKIMNRWYADEAQYQMARLVMFDELIHTPQVAGSSVYFTHIGNPSGNPITAILNTIINAMYMRYVWLKIAPREFRSLTFFESEICDREYGDDVVLSASERGREFFDPNKVSEELGSIQMKFTSASKDKEAQWKSIRDLQFLKRGFYTGKRGRILPTMDTGTIKELTNWIRKSDHVTPEQMTIDNINESLRFAFFRGKAFFTELRENILRRLQYGKEQINDWKYYYQWFYEDRGEMQVAQSNTFREETNAKGIVSLSQRDETKDTGSVGPIAKNKELACQAISDPAWSLPDMSKRKVWIGTYEWKVADAFQHTYVLMDGPKEFLVNYLQTAPFERFMYWNGSMTITIQVNGTRFHAGRLIAFYVPWTLKAEASSWHAVNMAAAWSVPNVQIDASSSNSGVLTIPFYNTQSVMFINGPIRPHMDFTGSFWIQVLSPLTASSGTVQQISFSVWVEFNEDQEFRVPTHSSAAAGNVTRFQRFQIAQGNTMTTDTVVNNYGSIEGQAAPTNVTGDSIGNGNSATLPMDKPARPWNPHPMYRKAFQNLASTVGSELTTRLDLHTANLNLSTAEMFGTEIDEMDLKHIHTRPTYVGAFAWQATDVVGTALCSRWIGPMASFFQNATENQISLTYGENLRISGWEYSAMKYRFWRGSVRIRLDVVGTQMHTGRLYLALNYGAPPESETTMRDATSQYGAIIDLSNECRTFTFEIPYNAPTPYLEVCRGPEVSHLEYSSWFAKYFMGSWSLRVLNPLVAPDNVSPNVQIMLSVAGGDDFEVYYPCQQNDSFAPVVLARNPVAPTFQVAQGDTQAADTGTDAVAVPTPVETMQERHVVIAPDGVKACPVHSHFGKRANIRHIGELTKRYNALYYTPITSDTIANTVPQYREPGVYDANPGNTTDMAGFTTIIQAPGGTAPTRGAAYLMYIAMPVAPLLPQGNALDTLFLATNGTSLLEWYTSMFRFWRGAMRYKIIWDGVKDYNGDALDICASGVVYLPGQAYPENGTMNWASTAVAYSGALAQTGQPSFTGVSGNVFSYVSYPPGLAVDANTEMAKYNDIEIPFTSVYNVLPVNNMIPQAYAEYEQIYPGHVLFLAKFYYKGDGASTTALQQHGLIGWPTIYRAGGDDFRMGTYLGPPSLRVKGVVSNSVTSGDPPVTTLTYYSSMFDTWKITTPAPEQEKRVERANSDMTESMIQEAMEVVRERKKGSFQVAQMNQINALQDLDVKLSKEVVDEIQTRMKSLNHSVIMDEWTKIMGRAGVLGKDGACFHVPYDVYKPAMAFARVSANVSGLGQTFRTMGWIVMCVNAWLTESEWSDPRTTDEVYREMERLINLGGMVQFIHDGSDMYGKAHFRNFLMGKRLEPTQYIRPKQIPERWRKLAMDYMQLHMLSFVWRIAMDTLYALAIGVEVFQDHDEREGVCVDCLAHPCWPMVPQDYPLHRRRYQGWVHIEKPRGEMQVAQMNTDTAYLRKWTVSQIHYKHAIEDKYDPETRQMKYNHQARSLLNELQQVFGDKMEVEIPLGNGDKFDIKARYKSHMLDWWIEQKGTSASKKKAQELANLAIVQELYTNIFEDADSTDSDEEESVSQVCEQDAMESKLHKAWMGIMNRANEELRKDLASVEMLCQSKETTDPDISRFTVAEFLASVATKGSWKREDFRENRDIRLIVLDELGLYVDFEEKKQVTNNWTLNCVTFFVKAAEWVKRRLSLDANPRMFDAEFTYIGEYDHFFGAYASNFFARFLSRYDASLGFYMTAAKQLGPGKDRKPPGV